MKEWSGSWGQCRVFLDKGSLSTGEIRSPNNELHVVFQQHWNKQFSQNSFPNPLVTPANHPGWTWTSITRWGLQARLPWQPWLWLQGVVESNVFYRIFLLERIDIFWLQQFSLKNTHTPSTENTDKSPHNNGYFKPADCCIMQLPYSLIRIF